MFIQEQGTFDLAGYGNLDSKIAIVGDFSSGYDLNAKKPFSGPAGQVLENCLHAVGLIRSDLYYTNVIKCKALYKEKFFLEGKTKFTEEGIKYVKLLQAEMSEVRANVILAAGPAAFAALCSIGNLSTYRGYIFPSTSLPGRKVIPIYHPAAAIRGMHIYQRLIIADLKKATVEQHFPEIRRPERQLVYNHPTITSALEWLDYYADQSIVGFDIEVLNYEVCCISFSSSPELACVIPLSHLWTLEEELQLWRGIQKVLGNPNSIKVVQNGMFDIPFLLTRCGVQVRGEIHDTMVAHSVMFPELQKGLGFLGSIYCGAQEYWKDTVKFKNIKDES